MKNKKLNVLVILTVIFILCFGSIITTNAVPKIKSKSVAMNVTSATINIGDIITLEGVMNPINSTDKLSWSSSDKRIATVNKYGTVTAIKEGKATITVKTSSKKTTKCVINVKKYLTTTELKNLISAQCLSEESIKALIKSNTLSEEDVNTIVENRLASLNNTWEDGTELSPDGFLLPYETPDISLTEIKVSKSHFTGKYCENTQKYKYTVELRGHLQNPDDSRQITLGLRYWSKTENVPYDIREYDIFRRDNQSMYTDVKTVF